MRTEISKLTACEVQTIYRPRHHTTKNVGWPSSDMQACIEPPPIPMIKLELDIDITTHTIKVNMQRNQS